MRIICPTCANHYEVASGAVPPEGQLVRCADCRNVWLVRPGEDARPPIPVADSPLAMPQATRRQEITPPIDMAAARARLRPRRERLENGGESRNGTLAILAAAILCVGAASATLGAREALARNVPATASLFARIGLPANANGLALRDVKSVLTVENGKTVLALEGSITNLRRESTFVPALRLQIRDTGEVPLYSWAAPAPKTRLAQGETVMFRSRLAAPPAGGKDVRVSFAD